MSQGLGLSWSLRAACFGAMSKDAWRVIALLVLFTLPLPSLPPLCPVFTHFSHHR